MTEQKITFLDEISHIQLRGGMYCGSMDTPRSLLKEIIENSTDEVLNGYADRLDIEYDNSVGVYTVRDSGRGLPIYQVPEFENQTAARLIFTKLFSSGKFDTSQYKYSAGLHGVGSTVVNALSSELSVRVSQGKKLYTLFFQDGQVVREVEDTIKEIPWWSTEITFSPSKKFFKSIRTTPDTLPLEIVKGMFPHVSITINREEVKPFRFENLFKISLVNDHVFTCKKQVDNLIFETYFGWSATEHNSTSKTTVNLVSTSGWAERKAMSMIGKALLEVVPESLSMPEDALYGLHVYVNLFAQDPVFTSQNKERLSHIKIEPPDLDKKLLEEFKKAFRDNPEITEAVVRKIVAYKKQLAKLSDSELVNSVIRVGNDKRKGKGVGVGIWECSTQKREEAELYIVEGQSAAGHVRQTRNLITQAVLPLRGKCLNVAVADDLKQILENEEMVSLINCIGAGLSPNVNLSTMRYGKILIAADADADGAQISNLILGALIYLIPEIVYAEKVYEILSPLYEQDGKYFYDLSELNTRKHFERFKGLGSMNPDEVETTIVNPKTRRLRKITLDDRDRILSILQSSSEKKRIMLQNGIIYE